MLPKYDKMNMIHYTLHELVNPNNFNFLPNLWLHITSLISRPMIVLKCIRSLSEGFDTNILDTSFSQ